jgi:hypothetical protein
VVEDKISDFLKRWVFDKSVAMQSLWSWILKQMVSVADTKTFEGSVGSWIQVSELVYAGVFEALAANGNDAAKVCELLGCPEVRFVDPTSRPKGKIIVIVGYFGSSKSTLGNLIAEEIGGKHFDCDGCKIWLETPSVLKLSSNRNMVTVAEILKLVSEGHKVVVSSGGGNIPNLKEKAAQLGFDLDIIVMAPENLGLYDDKSHIESLIKYRASLPGSTWKSDAKSIENYFVASQMNKVYAEKFITEAKSSSSPLFEYPQMRTPEDAAAFVAQKADELKALMQTTLTLQKVKCQRQQQNVVFKTGFSLPKFDEATRLWLQKFDTSTEDPKKKQLPRFTENVKPQGFAETPAHITLMFIKDLANLAIMQPLIPVGQSQEVTVSFCVAEVPEGIMSGTTLAPFLVVFIGEKSYHITIDSGIFTPASMKHVARAYFSWKDTAVFETNPVYTKATEKTPAVNKPSQTLTCNFRVVTTSATTIIGGNVVALN